VKRWIWAGLAAAVLVGGVLSLFASRAPDGLQKVAADSGFAGAATQKPVLSVALAGYRVPGIREDSLARGLAGFAGTLVLFGVGAGVGWLVGRRRKPGP
jgi:hypothetical protein